MAHVIQAADLSDHGVVLKNHIPPTLRRLDCLVCGRDGGHEDNAVIVGLKRWSKCRPSEGDNLVST